MRAFDTHKVSEQHAGLTVEQYLRQVLKCSGRKLQKLTRQKGILLNGRTVYLQKKVKASDIISVLIQTDNDYGVKPEPGDIEILYEDDFLLVLNKPAYQLVHPAGRTTGGTLANYLAHYLKQRGIVSTIRAVHRLDRNTSGCVIFAKDAHSQSLLNKQLELGLLKRSYQAVVEGIVIPPSGTIDAPIGPHPRLPNRRAVTAEGDPAVTHYQTIETFTNTSLLELCLDTGRTHQIRVHLSHIGHPVVGDSMYGTRSTLIARQALHAKAVTFAHLKDNRPITVQAPLPPDIEDLLKHNRLL